MKAIKDEIWILADNRPGNYSQAIGLADELGLNHKIVNISYGVFGVLPNLLLRSTLIGLDKVTKEYLQQFDYFPKIIVAAGRRTAPIALYLKTQSQNRTKIVQIMNPGIFHEKFDFIILPRHDRIKKSFANVIRSLGALTKINESAIEYECEKFSDLFKGDNKTKIALLVGGDTKKTKFEAKSAVDLIEKSAEIAKNMNAKLIVLTSRRTGKKISKVLQTELTKSKCDFAFFDYDLMKKEENPYLAIIGFSDYFIATGDSVSMISEVCSTKKPVYIYDDANMSTKKHKKFHKCLLLENYVRKLDPKIKFLEKFTTKRLNETKRIALIIKKYLE